MNKYAVLSELIKKDRALNKEAGILGSILKGGSNLVYKGTKGALKTTWKAGKHVGLGNAMFLYGAESVGDSMESYKKHGLSKQWAKDTFLNGKRWAGALAAGATIHHGGKFLQSMARKRINDKGIWGLLSRGHNFIMNTDAKSNKFYQTYRALQGAAKNQGKKINTLKYLWGGSKHIDDVLGKGIYNKTVKGFENLEKNRIKGVFNTVGEKGKKVFDKAEYGKAFKKEFEYLDKGIGKGTTDHMLETKNLSGIKGIKGVHSAIALPAGFVAMSYDPSWIAGEHVQKKIEESGKPKTITSMYRY